MSVGRIDFLDKYGEIEMSMEYDCWDKMSAQIALEDRFGDPFVAHVYSNDALDFSLSSTYSKVRYLQQLITKDMGFDRYWITEKEVTAAFYNPEKGPNSGCFVVYHMPFKKVLEADEITPDDNMFSDYLYGVEHNPPEYLDIGTEKFEEMLLKFPSGIRESDGMDFREWIVSVAKRFVENKRVEFKVNPILYYNSEINWDPKEAENIIRQRLENAGFIILDGSLDNIEEV